MIKNDNIKYSTLFIIFIILLFDAGSVISQAKDSWDTHELPIDNPNLSNNYLSMELDSNNRPHICFSKDNNRSAKENNTYLYQLKYAFYNGSDWIIETVDSNGDVGKYCSLSIDKNDNPHICYYDETNKNLKYAFYNGSDWIIETVDSNGDVGKYCSLAIDTNDNPHISYYDNSGAYGLKYAIRGKFTGTWSISTIDQGMGVGQYTSIDIGTDNLPCIAYYDFFHNNHSVRYAYLQPGRWNFETVDYDGVIGYGISLCIDANNRPHISYQDISNKALKYATKNNNKWEVDFVNVHGTVSSYTSLKLDSKGYPHICYPIIGDSKMICYTYWTGNEWYTQEISPGIVSVIDITTEDIPSISYINNNIYFIQPFLIIIEPTFGAAKNIGENCEISWNPIQQSSNYTILLYKENTQQLQIAYNLSTNTYIWEIPENIESGSYQLKILENNNQSRYSIITLKILDNSFLNTIFYLSLTIVIIVIFIIIVTFLRGKRR